MLSNACLGYQTDFLMHLMIQFDTTEDKSDMFMSLSRIVERLHFEIMIFDMALHQAQLAAIYELNLFPFMRERRSATD